MENILCPICLEEVEILNQVKEGKWIGLEVSCHCRLAKCPCGQIVDDSRISRPEYGVIASCSVCGEFSYQDPDDGYEEWLAAQPRKPSQETKEQWLYAERRKSFHSYPRDSENSGKWLVFIKRNEADEIWELIKKAVENGELGSSAKISTNSQGSIRVNPNQQVICVYTYDWTDNQDVIKIRQRLRELGITWKIPYKTDEDTSQLKYASRGDTKISKYYE